MNLDTKDLEKFLRDDNALYADLRNSLRTSVVDYLYKKFGKVDINLAHELLERVSVTVKVDKV
jgi:hypothetical protein